MRARRPGHAPVDPLVVTATRIEERAFDLPLSIDSIGATRIQQDQLQINLSESLSRVPGLVRAEPLELRAGPADFVARLRRARELRRARHPPLPGRHSGDDAGRPGPDRKLQPRFRAAHRSAARAVLDAVRQCLGRRGLDLHRRRAADADGAGAGHRRQLRHLERDRANSAATTNGVNYVVAANHFATDGYRDHSEASRDQFNAKLKFALDDDTRVTMIANTLYQPEAQDPLGLTRAQWQANPRQADPAATLFDTRKTVDQQQGGATIEHGIGADTTLRLTGYAGQRAVRQYLALAGIADTSSGGVTDLDGNFGGVDARVTTRIAARAAGR